MKTRKRNRKSKYKLPSYTLDFFYKQLVYKQLYSIS